MDVCMCVGLSGPPPLRECCNGWAQVRRMGELCSLEPRNPNPCATLIGQKAGPLPPPDPPYHIPLLSTRTSARNMHAVGGRAA